jgi:SNF2 family DNA or RNA helicase
VTGAAHLDELSKKTEDVILRRKKKECLTELPAKTRLFKETELEPKQSKAYQAEISRLVKEYRQRAKAGEVDPDAEALVTLNYLRKVGSEFKVDAAISLAEEILEQGQSLVIFTEFVESANRLYSRLGGELLTGATRPDERQGMVDRFQAGESKVFTGTIKAGGVGITLTAASHVILVDRPWTPGDVEQAEDRCHRLGQKNAVFATWLQLGQIDQAIDSLLQEKQQRIELVLKGKRKTLKGLDSPKELARQLMEIL